jgi:hypothetical protein
MGDIITRSYRTLLGLPKIKERDPPERRSEQKVLAWDHLEKHKSRSSTSSSGKSNSSGGQSPRSPTGEAPRSPRKSTSSSRSGGGGRSGELAGGMKARPPMYGDQRKSASNMV